MSVAAAGVVVIGRNEGPRLRACLAAVPGGDAPCVYVDSGSRDDSVAIARESGASVVELDTSAPYTAARSRNAGFEALLREHPDLAYVQFVDGDCVLAAEWFAFAAAHLAAHPKLAAVCGRLQEAAPEASFYNRMCEMEWNAPPGPTAACGGIFLARARAFREVAGFRADLIAGEEPELCFRLRRAGWGIERLDREMARHDAAMTHFGQWWRRMRRSGYAYAEGAVLHGRSPERYNVRESLRIWLWAAAVPTLALLGAVPTGGGSLLLLLLYPVLAVRIAQDRRRRGEGWGHGLRYAGFLQVGRFAQLLGQLGYLRDRLLGRRPALIEYRRSEG